MNEMGLIKKRFEYIAYNLLYLVLSSKKDDTLSIVSELYSYLKQI